MYGFSKSPLWMIEICAHFCLIQVMNWFEEMIASMNDHSRRFYWMGKRFDILPNRSFVLDDSLKVYDLNLNGRHQLN